MTNVKTYGWLEQERLQFINDNPKVLSLLYDLGLLPEEISARVRGYVEDAVKAERERCVKIAEAGNDACGSCHVDPQGCECPETSRLIAKRIRESKEQ